MILYHIAEESCWIRALSVGTYAPDSFTNEGFIHCSTASQVLGVAHRYYAGCKDLVLLTIDFDRVVPDIKFENLEGGEEQFPHIYGLLNIESVIRVDAFTSDATGHFQLPKST